MNFIREAGGSWLFYNTVLLEITVNRVITSGEGEVKGESSEVSHSVIAIECDASYRTVHKDCIRLTIW